MIIRAVQLFRRDHFIVTYHATREDGLAWIAGQRKTSPRGSPLR